MPIKQIQLRGISRTPSDRASADGGCAESLNVHLDQMETAPTLPPEDITEDIYGSAVDKKPIIFIHKMLGVTNYIGYSGRSFLAYGSTLPAAGDNMGGAYLASGERLNHVSSIGNTLIVYSDAKPYYFLFKDGAYIFLGNEIPKPAIEIITRPSDNDRWTKDYVEVAPGGLRTAKESGTNHPDVEAWNDANDENNSNHDELLQTMENIWDVITLKLDNRRKDGIFAAPFFIRYGLRLYDGSYIYLSTPILCGGGKSYNWAEAYLYDNYYTQVGPGGNYEGFLVHVTLNNLFKVRVKGSYTVGNWNDIVKSIDFFASSPIYTPQIRAKFNQMSETASSYHHQGYSGFDIIFYGMEQDAKEQTIKDAVLSKGQFYKIKSIDIANSSDMEKLGDGTMKIEASEDINGDMLFTHEELVDGYHDGNQYIPTNGSTNYNNRLLLVGATELLSHGDMFLNGQVADKAGSATLEVQRFVFRYKIVNPTTGEVSYVNAKYRDGTNQLREAYIVNFSSNDTAQYHGDETPPQSSESEPYHKAYSYAWICYPDTRCTEVEVFGYFAGVTNPIGIKIPLEKHPLLECSYAFIGFGTKLDDIFDNSGYDTAPIADLNAAEKRTITGSNKLYLSSMDNPFIIPAANIITFPNNVVGAATTSVALSEGQFGEFPMYVFTEGGIRVLATNSEGTFSANMAQPNLSRHVALPGTITPLEQAIAFITERGVMLITGSQVVELSRNMNGMPFIPDAGLTDLIQRSSWSAYLYSLMETEPFMAFMQTAEIAYDNKGGRLIFFNRNKAYQYVYMFETQSWHKIFTSARMLYILNSYPDCLITYLNDRMDAPVIYNFSTNLHDADVLSDTANPVKGIIVTRPFDLGEPDIRKAIRNIRIRGKFNREDVQYILLGSFDDIHWERLRSLRGGSFKLFRMILLCNLTPTERITWIDVDYESRFTNRLR